jgi:tetratricopeptide (TPR) repeat protein
MPVKRQDACSKPHLMRLESPTTEGSALCGPRWAVVFLRADPDWVFNLNRSEHLTLRIEPAHPRRSFSCGIGDCRLPVWQSQATQMRIGVYLSLLACTLLLATTGFSQTPPQTVEGFLAQAGEHEKSGDYPGAEEIYQQALAQFPNQPELLKRLGIIYQTELKFPDSIATFQEVLQQSPEYPEVNFYMGLSYFGLNQYAKAIGYFNDELKFHPDYRRAHYYAAQALIALGRKGEAIQHFETLVKQNPNDTKVWYELARLYRSMAVHAYNQIAHVDPDSVFLYALRAAGYTEDLKFPEAIKEYEEVLKRQPDFPGVHFALGDIYFKMFKPAEAEPELKLALQEDPNNPPANYMLGQLLLRDKKASEALPLLQVAATGDPTFMKSHLELGKCYMELGKLQEAVAALSEAAEIDPHSKDPHVLLAQTYERLKDDSKRDAELAILDKLRKERNERLQEAVKKAAEKK